MAFKFEGSELNPEQEFEKLTRKDKFEIVLKLFGTDTARENFLSVCRQYIASRGFSWSDSHGENYATHNRGAYSPPKRADLHNQIMETLKHLSIQKLDPLARKILEEMASREVAAETIKEWVLSHDGGQDEDDDELERKHRDLSGPAYFHSLGKGQ